MEAQAGEATGMTRRRVVSRPGSLLRWDRVMAAGALLTLAGAVLMWLGY